MTRVKDIDVQDFESEVLNHQGKVLVDFYAPWCGPCKMIAPVVEQVASDAPEVKVIKVNADNAPDLMSQYGVRGIPTLLLLNNGQLIDRKVGAASLGQVKAFVEQ